MRFENDKVSYVINALRFLGIGFLFLLIVMMFFKLDKFFMFTPLILLILGLSVLLAIYFSGPHYFRYDSDGEVLIFIQKNLFFGYQNNFSKKTIEFPKRKLLKYRVKNSLFFKYLYLDVSSKEKGVKTIKFNVTFISQNQFRLLKKSLDKISKRNKETLRQQKLQS